MRRLAILAATFFAVFIPYNPVFAADWSSSNPSMTSINGSCVQFSYQQATAQTSFPINSQISSAEVTVVIDNSFTNKIGNDGEVIDSYSITLELSDGATVLASTSYSSTGKHGPTPFTLTLPYSGSPSTAILTITAVDNGFWGGFYGPIACNPTLVIAAAEPTPEPTPSETPTATPEPTPSETPTAAPEPEPTQQPTNQISATVNEGGWMELAAPEGTQFTEVVFASYGTPDNYTTSWCHAETSASRVSEAFIGKSSGSISATNDVFGDPCGGTYKHLSVILAYTATTPPVETPTVTPETPTVTPETPTVTPETPTVTPEPTPTPTPTPAPEPEPQQPPAPEPEPEPVRPEPVTPTPEPVTPTPEPEPEPPVEEPPAEEPPAEEPPVEEPPAEEPPVEEPPIEEPPVEEPPVEPEPTEPEQPADPEPVQPSDPEPPAPSTPDVGPDPVPPTPDEPAEEAPVEVEVPAVLAAVPVLGDALEIGAQAVEALFAVGSDMTPEQREESQKVVVAAVVVGQIATQAAAAAAASAASAATRRIK